MEEVSTEGVGEVGFDGGDVINECAEVVILREKRGGNDMIEH